MLSEIEVHRLLTACGDRTASQRRTRALIVLLYRSGLRVNEAVKLRPKDVDLVGHAVRVLHGKGGLARTVGIDPGGVAVLRDWLATRRMLGLTERDSLLCSLNGEELSCSYVRRWLPALGRRAGIFKRVHAHGLRHTHAAELRAEGVDIGVISKQLGHRSIATTARYLDHIAPLSVIAAIRQRAWSAVATDADRTDQGTPP